jgi:hypothetical protein
MEVSLQSLCPQFEITSYYRTIPSSDSNVTVSAVTDLKDHRCTYTVEEEIWSPSKISNVCWIFQDYVRTSGVWVNYRTGGHDDESADLERSRPAKDKLYS